MAFTQRGGPAITKGQRTVAGLLAVGALAIPLRVFAQPASTGVTGVCCIDDPISCIIATQAECAQQGGIYGGDGTICLLNPFGDCTCGPGAGNCTDPLGNGTPGCELLQCCGIVCLNNPTCCSFEWDAPCAFFAASETACFHAACEGNLNPCGLPNATGGCDILECCDLVCSVNPDCCDIAWDQACVDLAAVDCVALPCAGIDLSCATLTEPEACGAGR